MGLFLDRLLAWFGLKERKQRSTIPPPRINPKWDKPFPRDSAMPIIPIEIDEDATPPDGNRRPRHARKRPPSIKRDKP